MNAERGTAASERLERSFFDRDPVLVARELIGCTLLADGVGGRIVETEAYAEYEPACHAHAGVTERTRVLFGPPGHAYVYLSYGIHQLFNIVTEREGTGAAVLIRALEPTHRTETMRSRRVGRRDGELCAGPGRLTEALSIGPLVNGVNLGTGPISLHRGAAPADSELLAGPRIGISKAIELDWRFCEAGSRWLSAPEG